jgi:hypothetical protein
VGRGPREEWRAQQLQANASIMSPSARPIATRIYAMRRGFALAIAEDGSAKLASYSQRHRRAGRGALRPTALPRRIEPGERRRCGARRVPACKRNRPRASLNVRPRCRAPRVARVSDQYGRDQPRRQRLLIRAYPNAICRGQAVRFIDLAANAGTGFGLFDYAPEITGSVPRRDGSAWRGGLPRKPRDVG